MSLKERFMVETRGMEYKAVKVNYLVVAVKLPNGAVELITNTQELEKKAEYYLNAYDDNFCLKSNPAIQIVNFMLA